MSAKSSVSPTSQSQNVIPPAAWQRLPVRYHGDPLYVLTDGRLAMDVAVEDVALGRLVEVPRLDEPLVLLAATVFLCS